MASARAGLEGAMPALASESHRGKEYWGPADGGAPEPALASGLHLLAGYDEFFLGYRGRDDVIDPTHAAKVVPGANGIFRPMIVQGGQVVGTWKRVPKAKGLLVELAPFGKLKATKREIASAAGRVAEFLGVPLSEVSQG